VRAMTDAALLIIVIGVVVGGFYFTLQVVVA
jgi:hypothetical protein